MTQYMVMDDAEPVSAQIDTRCREQDFMRARPQLKRLATRLLANRIDVERVLEEVRDAWHETSGLFDTPVRYLLRLVVHRCATLDSVSGSQYATASGMEDGIMAIADDAQLSLLNAVHRMPKYAREVFVATILDRAAALVPAEGYPPPPIPPSTEQENMFPPFSTCPAACSGDEDADRSAA
ncbi:hypothetical protein [Sphingobium sp.]|uniref:hypothetical protein n=1 Tax=Sphingobium sp. TaxID=1912891 RepID=UPI003B3B7FD3